MEQQEANPQATKQMAKPHFFAAMAMPGPVMSYT